MKQKPVIAIDGYSSTGKSSISKEIAKQLNLIHLDTGTLYRGITLFAIENFSENEQINIPKLLNNLNEIQLEFRNINNELVLYLNNKDISKEIRLPKVSDKVSFIAKQAEVRAFLLKTQQDMAKNNGIIMDGRDIGSVVLPNADYKFFLTASIDERAKRRYAELTASGDYSTDISTVKQNLLHRDKIDSEREISPLKKADDAILIDNTFISKEESVKLIISYIQ